jgi:hypothetical protein
VSTPDTPDPDRPDHDRPDGSRRRRSRADYERGLPDYHDPTAGFGGAPPARSALTLRLWLASIGTVLCVLACVLAIVFDEVGLGVAMGALGLFALLDVAWVVHRKRRGEPG